MTIVLGTSIVSSVLAYFFSKQIRRYSYVLFALTAVLALVLSEEANIVSMGYVPLGLFLVIMFAGAMDRSNLRKRLFMVRKEMAIVASILFFAHGLTYLDYYLDDVGFFQAGISFYLGVLSFIIILPLFVTSFSMVRKQMSYKSWKKLHQLSYVFYGLLTLHLILIQNDRMWLYIGVFGLYWMLKIFDFIVKKRQT